MTYWVISDLGAPRPASFEEVSDQPGAYFSQAMPSLSRSSFLFAV